VEVFFTPLAERHLESLHRYIAENGFESRADRFVDDIITHCQGLATFPMRGVSREDIAPGLRIIGFRRRVSIAYAVTEGAIYIAGIYYAGRNVPPGPVRPSRAGARDQKKEQ